VTGIVYLLQTAAVDVDIVVDLNGTGTLSGESLRELRVTIYDSSGDWVGSTVHTFLPSLYPNGPPIETAPAKMHMKKGEYEVRMDFFYGRPGAGKRYARRVLMEVKEQGRILLVGGR